MKSKVIFLLLIIFHFAPIYAQNAEPDFMRSVGKIYVVVATIASIFIGIVVLLFLLERRISKLEKQLNNHE